MAASLESVNEELDDLMFAFFEKIEELQSARSALANAMKSGFLLMSKARYSMGNKSVSSLQYSSKMEATVKVITKDEFVAHSRDSKIENADESPKVFQLSIDDFRKAVEEHGTLEVHSNISENLVRRRQVRLKEEEEKHSLYSKKAGDESTVVVNEKSVKMSTDPLKWFGVLVPSCLRQSQQEFKSSLQVLCEIAELECEVNRITSAYKKLKELKYKST